MSQIECGAQITRFVTKSSDLAKDLNMGPLTQNVTIDCDSCPARATFSETSGHALSDAMQANRRATKYLAENCGLTEDGAKVIAPDGLKPNGDPDGLLVQTTACENAIWPEPRPAVKPLIEQ